MTAATRVAIVCQNAHPSVDPSTHDVDRYGRSGEAECLLCSWSAAANAAALVTVAALALPTFALYVRRVGPAPRRAGPVPRRPYAMPALHAATPTVHTQAHARTRTTIAFGAGEALGGDGGDSAAGRAEPPGQERAFAHELPFAPHAVPDPVAQGTTLASGG